MELCNVCLFMFIWIDEPLRNAAGVNSMCTMLFSNARTAQMLLSKGLGMPTKESP